MPGHPYLQSIHIYPVKSFRGLSLDEAVVEPWGLAGDRRWMLVDHTGRLVSQRQEPRVALLMARVRAGGGLLLAAPGAPPLVVSAPPPGGPAITVQIFRDSVTALPAAEDAQRWLSRYCQAAVRLVYLDDPNQRQIDRDVAAPQEAEYVSLADCYPLLLTTSASLAALNELMAETALALGERAPKPLPMNRFRPNVVIDGTAPWAEDGWRTVRMGEVTFRVAGPCGRCLVTTIDQDTTEQGPEPLRTLGRHRQLENQLIFGQSLIPNGGGSLRVGDEFAVLDAMT